MKKLIRKGKEKEVYELNEGELEFLFTDNISIYGKEVPNEIPRKGETLCKTAVYWFGEAEESGLNTHFKEMKDENKILVDKVEMIEDYDKIDQETRNYLIPLQFVSRYFVAGSLHDRIQRGEIDHEELGFDEKPEYGERLNEPFFEVMTKFEEYNRTLGKEEALDVSGLTEEEYSRIEEIVYELDGMIEDKVEKNGLIHVDGKKEFAMDEDRELMIVDTFGTADQDRFWSKDEYQKGNFVQKSKGFVKEYYKENGYHEKVMEARRKGQEEPPAPPLPEEKVKEISELYIDLMSRLTDGNYGEKNG